MSSRVPRPNTVARVKTILRRDLKLGPDVEVSDTTPFFGSEMDLDSLDVLLLLTSIEKEFGIKVPNEAVGRAIFENVKTLALYVDEQTAPAEAPGAAASSAPVAGQDLLDRLPHRPPFRFISRMVQIRAGDCGEAIWSLNGAEPFFAGHFPGQPIVPGVLIAEALAQVSGLVGIAPAGSNGNGNGSGHPAWTGGKLAQVDVRFEQAVAPPADIVLQSRLVREMGPLQMFEVAALVGQTVIARGTLALARTTEPSSSAAAVSGSSLR